MVELEQRVSEKANALLGGKKRLKMLEAGCGSATHIAFDAELYVVGIDISSEQLKKNNSVSEKLQGDIQEYPLPACEFDVAICWMVLEHLERPRAAVLNLSRALRPGGLLILGFPNLWSIKGIVTKITPYWFHRGFYRYLKYTSHPFPTFFKTDIIPGKLARYAESNGLTVELCALAEGRVSRVVKSRYPVVKWLFSAVDGLTRVLSRGRLTSPLLDQCGMVLRKRAGDA